jgi:pyruvate dehydrogenase E2 component (dihydrolipoamide acetyltransferase)
MSGGSMTISNLGGIGGTYFTPIVNWPEVAILGVSRGATEPVWRPSSGSFEPRQMLPLSLSYDHRLIDGADAMRFLRWVVEAVEQPFLLSLIG